MTDQEFLDWWHKKSFRWSTKQQRDAWSEFLYALEKEYECDVGQVNKIPPHVREPFMAGCTLIFG